MRREVAFLAVVLALAAPAQAASPQETYQEIWKLWSSGAAKTAESRLKVAVLQFPQDARLGLFLAACIASYSADEESDLFFEPLVGQAARSDRVCLEALVAQDYLHLSDPKTSSAAFAHLAASAKRDDPIIVWIYAQAALRLRKTEAAVSAFQALLRHTTVPPAIVRQGYAEALEADVRLRAAQERRLVIAQEFCFSLTKRGT